MWRLTNWAIGAHVRQFFSLKRKVTGWMESFGYFQYSRFLRRFIATKLIERNVAICSRRVIASSGVAFSKFRPATEMRFSLGRWTASLFWGCCGSSGKGLKSNTIMQRKAVVRPLLEPCNYEIKLNASATFIGLILTTFFSLQLLAIVQVVNTIMQICDLFTSHFPTIVRRSSIARNNPFTLRPERHGTVAC